MKRIFCLLLIAFSLTTSAQNDVTTFLGIPVDGTKEEMRSKLIKKGFKPDKLVDMEYLKGEFNGEDVKIFIATNKNKVYRIMVCDEIRRREASIKNRFNVLVSQFENNKRYLKLDDYTIPNDVDISYEMSVNNKSFVATFFQMADPEKIDSIDYEKINQQLLKKYTIEQIYNETEEVKKEKERLLLDYITERSSNKPVRFQISEFQHEYYITMYYDNEYNCANGEDL